MEVTSHPDLYDIVTGPGAHNDILDTELAGVIWFCLRQVEQPPTADASETAGGP